MKKVETRDESTMEYAHAWSAAAAAAAVMSVGAFVMLQNLVWVGNYNASRLLRQRILCQIT